MSSNVQDAPDALRIPAKDVLDRISRGEDVYFVDTRNPMAWAKADTRLPGAARVPADAAEEHLADMPRNRRIVTYCT